MNLAQQGKQALAVYAQTHHQITTHPNTSQCEELNIAVLQAAPVDTATDEVQSALDFAPFEHSALWQKQRDYFVQQGPKAWQERKVPHYITHTVPLVKAYAQVMLHYIVDGLQNGSIDPEQPLYLLELGAGCGRFAMQLLRTLDPLLKHCGLEELDYCYLITDVAEENCQFSAHHAYLQPYLEQGRAAVHCVDVENLQLDNRSPRTSKTGFYKPLPTTGNPVILVANYLFDSLPQALLYVHYGELYSADVALLPESDNQSGKSGVAPDSEPGAGFGQVKLAYRWQKKTAPEQWIRSQPPALQDFLGWQIQHYLNHLHSQPLLIPIAALSCLQQLQQHFDQGMLLMMADFGILQQPQLSRQTLPKFNVHGSVSLPVNYDCIRNWQLQQTNLCRCIQHREQGLIFNIAIADAQQRDYPLTLQSTEEHLVAYNPDDFFQIKRSLHCADDVLTEAQQLAYLRLSDYDPRLLAIFLPYLLREGVLLQKRVTWCFTLSQVWQNYLPIGENDDFAFKLGLLAINLSHWSLARQCFFSVVQYWGASAATFHNMALTFHATGEQREAAYFVERAVKLAQDDAQILKLAAEIDSWRRYCEQLSWFYPVCAGKESLRLQPLGQHHSGEFWTQYHDSDIATMLRSYKISTPVQADAAIHYWAQQSDRADYAVLHQELGLVGVTSLSLNDQQHSAHFYFWIGKDYQGRGFGQQAAQLCIQQATAQGIELLLTCAWQHNQRSQAVLLKAGFKPLDFTRGEGVQQEIYYYQSLSPQADEEQFKQRAQNIVRQQSDDEVTFEGA